MSAVSAGRPVDAVSGDVTDDVRRHRTDDVRGGGPRAGRTRAAASRLRAHVGRDRVAYGVALLTFAAYAVLSVRKYQRLEAPSWDLGIFDQAVRTMAAGHAPVALIKGVGYNIFGDHFHPVIALLVPLYRVFPSGITLLVVQDLLVAASAFVVTRLAVRLTGTYPGAGIGAAYAVSWGLQAAVVAQFHEVAFALPLVAASLAALVEQRWRACVLWAAPLVFVKEDLGITVALVGLLVIWRSRRDAPWLGGKLGTGLAVWGLLGFVVAVKLVLPSVNSQGVWDYQSQVQWSVFGDPAALVHQLVHPVEKVTTAAWVFAVTGFLALRSPLALLTLPTFAWRYLSDVPAYWGRGWHYDAVLMPIVFVALLDAVLTVRERPARFDPAPLRRYATAAAPVVAALAAAFAVDQQLALTNLVRPSFYATPARVAVAHRVLDLVPAGASVESDEGLIVYLAEDHDTYWMARPGNPPPEYFVVDAATGGWNEAPTDVVGYAEQLHPGTRYEKIFDADSYVLLRRIRG